MKAFKLKELNSIDTRLSGEYLLDRFFIKIKTERKRADLPGYEPGQEKISDQAQALLLAENQVTIVHEHIHYLHEVSTMLGITQFYFEVISRAIFADFTDLPNSSNYRKPTGNFLNKLNGLRMTRKALNGGADTLAASRIISRIDSIALIQFSAVVPFQDRAMPINIPFVTYTYTDRINGIQGTDSLYFGKYFLYEGLAHHLDHIAAKHAGIQVQPDDKFPPEYKVMRIIAKHLCPGIEERNMLELASLSLSHLNAGEKFVEMLQGLHKTKASDKFINEMKSATVRRLKSGYSILERTLAAIQIVFKSRQAMRSAANYLCQVMLAGYKARLDDPVFEVSYIYTGKIRELNGLVPVCDMMYEFTDNNSLMRDFGGTRLPAQLSNDLKTLLCNVDYYLSATSSQKEHSCPLFTVCGHAIRKSKPDQCATHPRLAFEDHPSYGNWCHYGLGVAYMKGEDD